MPNLKLFLENNIGDLIKITITERKDKGFGAIYVIHNETTNQIDCRYIEVSNPAFNPELLEQFKKFEEDNSSSIIYFILIEEKGCEIVLFDLDSRNKN
jgi:hypothetical protein